MYPGSGMELTALMSWQIREEEEVGGFGWREGREGRGYQIHTCRHILDLNLCSVALYF